MLCMRMHARGAGITARARVFSVSYGYWVIHALALTWIVVKVSTCRVRRELTI